MKALRSHISQFNDLSSKTESPPPQVTGQCRSSASSADPLFPVKPKTGSRKLYEWSEWGYLENWVGAASANQTNHLNAPKTGGNPSWLGY